VQTSLPNYLSKTTANVARLNRLLSKTSTLDTTLLTTTYTLHLIHALLPVRATPHDTASPLSKLRTNIAPINRLLDEFRVLLRLWGLLGIFMGGASIYTSPPKDPILKAIAWGQVTSIGIYQALENGAFLSAKGVMGWDAKKQGKAWLWGSRAWMVYVGLELSRLGYEWRQRTAVEAKSKDLNELAEQVESSGVIVPEGGLKGDLEAREEKEKGELVLREEKIERQQWWSKWERDLGASLGYAPMTVHYSMENGPLGEGALGALGVIVAWFRMGEAWRQTA